LWYCFCVCVCVCVCVCRQGCACRIHTIKKLVFKPNYVISAHLEYCWLCITQFSWTITLSKAWFGICCHTQARTVMMTRSDVLLVWAWELVMFISWITQHTLCKCAVLWIIVRLKILTLYGFGGMCCLHLHCDKLSLWTPYMVQGRKWVSYVGRLLQPMEKRGEEILCQVNRNCEILKLITRMTDLLRTLAQWWM